MQLVIFTGQYPYGAGEVFLEDEMRIAEQKFDSITIVTYAKAEETLTRYVPHNATLVHLRRGKTLFSQLAPLFILPFKPYFWREVCSGCKERGISNIKTVLKQIILTEKRIISINQMRHFWEPQRDNCIYYSYWINPAAVYLARKKATLQGICIARTHGGDCFFSRGYVPYRPYVLQKLDCIYPISESGRMDIISHYAMNNKSIQNRIRVARLGVDLPDLNSCCQNKLPGLTIVTCSNVIQLKRLDLVVEALSLIDEIEVNWVHFGDGPLMEQIRLLTHREIDSKKNIKFDFRGWVSNSEISEFYKTNYIDLFINCSDVEGIPVSIMEAMSFGIPAIARDVGGNSELVDNEVGCLLPTEIEPRDIVDAINRIIYENDGISISLRRKNARLKIEQQFNAKKNYSIFFDVNEEMARNESHQ